MQELAGQLQQGKGKKQEPKGNLQELAGQLQQGKGKKQEPKGTLQQLTGYYYLSVGVSTTQTDIEKKRGIQKLFITL